MRAGPASIFFALAFALISATAFAELPYSLPNPDGTRYPVFAVYIRADSSHDFEQVGSAFLISQSGFFLSASHVFPRKTNDNYDGQIRLLMRAGKDVVTLDGVREIYHRESQTDPDVSVLRSPEPITNRAIEARFELGVPAENEDNRKALIVYGYPSGTETLGAVWSAEIRVNPAPHTEFPAYLGSGGGIYPGHSGAPLFLSGSPAASRLIVYGVVYGSSEYLRLRSESECTAHTKKATGLCADASQGFLQGAIQNGALLASRLDPLEPPFWIGHRVVSERARALFDAFETHYVVEGSAVDDFLQIPPTAAEASAILAYISSKDASFLRHGNRLTTIARISNAFKRVRKEDLLKIANGLPEMRSN